MGIEAEVSPLFSNNYLERLYGSGNWFLSRLTNASSVLNSYGQRLSAVLRCGRFDVIWIEKELFPFLPGMFESLIIPSGVPYLVDFDDAIFYYYDNSPSRVVRLLLGQKMKPLLEHAYAVTAGNDYLAERLKDRGARRVFVIPTVVDSDRYGVESASQDTGKPVVVGWIGSPSSSQYLALIGDALREVAKQRNIVFAVMGASPMNVPGVPFRQVDWSFDTEASFLSAIDIGVMPLMDGRFESGKCGYKLIQYMAAGKPVIASPVGVNRWLVEPSVGCLANDTGTWVRALLELIDDPSRRAALGRAARELVERKFSIQAVLPNLAQALRTTALSRS